MRRHPTRHFVGAGHGSRRQVGLVSPSRRPSLAGGKKARSGPSGVSASQGAAVPREVALPERASWVTSGPPGFPESLYRSRERWEGSLGRSESRSGSSRPGAALVGDTRGARESSSWLLRRCAQASSGSSGRCGLAPPGAAGCESRSPRRSQPRRLCRTRQWKAGNRRPREEQPFAGVPVLFVLKAEVVKRRQVQKSHLRLRLRRVDGA